MLRFFLHIGGRTSPPARTAGRPSDQGPAQPVRGDVATSRQCATGADLYRTTRAAAAPRRLTPSPGRSPAPLRPAQQRPDPATGRARAGCRTADALHKATTHLAARYETVVVEDLNVTGMLANRRLARAVADQGFGAVRRMLDYKTGWNGGRLIVADRWFPSSKTCSGCGGRKPSLSPSERTYRCDGCGLVLGRDVNAAINLRDLAASGAERQNACGGDVRPGPAGRPPVKQEPGTTPRVDQTGTAAAQATANWTADTHIRSHLR
ncbi:RNA-guided endonuclease InsQ/TnpB family protein [Actinomadura physcomitrii]|nr:transposase [Actinomadura physcomitrii]